jgi:hypothetical protein
VPGGCQHRTQLSSLASLSRSLGALRGACLQPCFLTPFRFKFARLERLQAPFIYTHTDLAAQTGGKDSCPRPPHPVIFRPKVSRRVMNSTIRLHFATVFERLLDGRWFSVVRVCVCGGGGTVGGITLPSAGLSHLLHPSTDMPGASLLHFLGALRFLL